MGRSLQVPRFAGAMGSGAFHYVLPALSADVMCLSRLVVRRERPMCRSAFLAAVIAWGMRGGAGRYVLRSPVSPSSVAGAPPSPPGGRLLR